MARETWVDFKAVKTAVTMEMVFQHYGLLETFERKGDRLSGPCPIHKGSNKKQFSADVKKGAFKCFSCGDHGNVVDLVASIEGVDFRKAALLMQEWFEIKPKEESSTTKKEEWSKRREWSKQALARRMTERRNKADETEVA